MLKKVDTNVKAEFNTEVSGWREYHMGLKIPRAQAHLGSIPTSGTT
ncbi:MAG: hypothetical protein ABIJ52_14345 [Pseudomonadota bacterium]